MLLHPLRRHHAAELRIVGAEPLGELGAVTELGGLDHGGSWGGRFSVVRIAGDGARAKREIVSPCYAEKADSKSMHHKVTKDTKL